MLYNVIQWNAGDIVPPISVPKNDPRRVPPNILVPIISSEAGLGVALSALATLVGRHLLELPGNDLCAASDGAFIVHSLVFVAKHKFGIHIMTTRLIIDKILGTNIDTHAAQNISGLLFFSKTIKHARLCSRNRS